MTSILINSKIPGDLTRDQSSAIQAVIDATADGTEFIVTEPVRASLHLRGKGKTLRTVGAGTIIGAAPLSRLVSEHERRRVNVLCEGEDLTVSAAIAATGGGALGFRNCLRSRARDCVLTVNSHELASAVGQIMAYGGDFVDVENCIIVGTTDDPEFGGIRLGNANADEILPNGNITGNRISRCGHSLIGSMCAGEVANNILDGTGQTNGSAIAVAHDVPRRWRHIYGNKIRNSPYHGIQADAGVGVVTRRVLCEDNDIEGCGQVGIYLPRAAQWIVRANTVKRNGRTSQSDVRGIVVSHGSNDIVIADNDLAEQPGGILIVADGENIEGVEVRGNRVHSTTMYPAFAVKALGGSTVLNVITHGNRWAATDREGRSIYVSGNVRGLVLGRDEYAGTVYRNVTELVGGK